MLKGIFEVGASVLECNYLCCLPASLNRMDFFSEIINYKQVSEFLLEVLTVSLLNLKCTDYKNQVMEKIFRI